MYAGNRLSRFLNTDNENRTFVHRCSFMYKSITCLSLLVKRSLLVSGSSYLQ